MAKIQSVKTVGETLVKIGVAHEPITVRDIKEGVTRQLMKPGYSVGDETFGKKSCLYLDCRDHNDRLRVERLLIASGVKVNTNYWPRSATTEIEVSYFRGTRCDE